MLDILHPYPSHVLQIMECSLTITVVSFGLTLTFDTDHRELLIGEAEQASLQQRRR
jgi:hypothetical protein